ncbi:TPR repeat [Chthonomonas calidirosea]|uniref:TPR repeat n=1 Tax=Chthonomonas calidirosea (strain DSM 23976 / ICMP 18418 / T49) TaxID=1303518 RepID=S0ET39_CHTCT|nr:tetratricopeptide repeat protein [Chthonomonas calidirosea]CCW34519.1 TPR repeat [Chthonomonas calidirosea T49]CEK14551.1 TPR repeat [Chthonomonas calidirosea]
MPTQREAGLRALKQGDFERARVLLESACWQYPEDFKAHYLLGAVYYSCRRYDQAVSALQRAVFLKPHSPQAHYNLGIALERIGKWDDAANEVRKALELDPRYEVASGTLRKWARAGKISLTPEEEDRLLAGLPRNWLTSHNADAAPSQVETSSQEVQSSTESEALNASPFSSSAMLPPFMDTKPSPQESVSPPISQPVAAQDNSLDVSSANQPSPPDALPIVTESAPQQHEIQTQTSSEEGNNDPPQTDVPTLQPSLLAPPPIEWSQPDEVPLLSDPLDPVLLQEALETANEAAPPPSPVAPPPILSEVASPPAATLEEPTDNLELTEPLASSVSGEVLIPPEIKEPTDVNVLELLAPPEIFEVPTPESLPTPSVPPPVIEEDDNEKQNLAMTSIPEDSLSAADNSSIATESGTHVTGFTGTTVRETETTSSHPTSLPIEPVSASLEPPMLETPLEHATHESAEESASSPPHKPSLSTNAPEETASAADQNRVQSKSRSAKARASDEPDTEDYIYFVPVPCQEATEALQIAIASLVLFVVGIVLGPIAIRKAIEAKRWIAASPYFTGATQANIALVLGVLSTVISLIFCIHYVPTLFATH